MDRRRYSTMLVLAAAALVAEACSSSSGTKGTGGADGGSSSGGATGTGGKADAGTGGMGTGGKVDAGDSGTGGMGTGGKVDAGDSGTGGMGTGGKVDAGDSGTDTPTDTATDMSLNIDTGLDADPAAPEKSLCQTAPYMSVPASVVPFTPTEFCTLYFSLCNSLSGVTHFATQAECQAMYSGYSTTPDADLSPSGQQGCRTVHLCLANNMGVMPHCAHATGLSGFDGGNGPPCM